jgi:hypothetical protein
MSELLTEADVPDVPLVLVDGNNLLFRAWLGFPARIRSSDKTPRPDRRLRLLRE